MYGMEREYFEIEGGRPLVGKASVHGAKNAVLPLLACSVLTKEPVTVCDVPFIRDVDNMVSVLASLGLNTERSGRCITVTGVPDRAEIPPELSGAMRSSMFMLGALLTVTGEVRMAAPGGCRIGARPLDIHLDGLQAMGATVEYGDDHVHCYARGLRGAEIVMKYPSVGATENLMISAVLAKGETMLVGCAREPEICALASGLRAMGAHIYGDGTSVMRIKGTDALGECRMRPPSDRIETGTLLAAVALNGGRVHIEGADLRTLNAVCDVLCSKHFTVTDTPGGAIAEGDGVATAKDVVTGPYPLFPTDMQAQICAYLCCAEGESRVKETVFENRFAHIRGLCRLGARAETDGRTAYIHGGGFASGTDVEASDLRGGAALAIAAMRAKGKSRLFGTEYIDRGYEDFEGVYSGLGAVIARRRG